MEIGSDVKMHKVGDKKLVHVLLYDNFVRYFVMMSQKFGMKIYYLFFLTGKLSKNLF